MADLDEKTVIAAYRAILADGGSPNDESVAKMIGAKPGSVRRIRRLLEASGEWSVKPSRGGRLTDSDKPLLLEIAKLNPDKSFFEIAEEFSRRHGKTVRATVVGYVVSNWQADIARSLLASKPDASLESLRIHIRKTTGFSVGAAKAGGWIAQYGKKRDAVVVPLDRPVDPVVLDRLDQASLRKLSATQLANLSYRHARLLGMSQLNALRYKAHLLPNISVPALDSAIAIAIARGLGTASPSQGIGGEDDG